jgi:benzylsuccinate CoA-transferase BbsF subunit/naphthyl-2-methylsuccinate CoA transferase subunit
MNGADRPSFGPLVGVRVIDLTVALAGAFSTMLLADLGAEVIKVESLQHYPTSTKGPRNPPRGDDAVAMSASRDYPDADPGRDPWNRLSWFNSQARNKLDVTMDISRPSGRELFLRLIERSDGLVENNTAGLLEKLDIGPDVLLAHKPGLIVVRMPPLGLSGPDHEVTGFGWHFEDLGGFLKVQGYQDGEEVGSIFMDAASGPAGANAFLMALLQRRRTGRGVVCEVSQLENMICHIGDLVMEGAINQRVPPRWGNRSPDFAPQGVYRCAGEDRWVALTVRNDDDWRRLRDLLGDPDALRLSSFETLVGRQHGHDEIDRVISAWTQAQDNMTVAVRLQERGIPAGPVMNEADACSDPHLHEREFFQMLEHPSAGVHFHPGANFHLSATPPRIWRAAPTLGQDNEYVYKDILGVSDEEYEALIAEGHAGHEYV